MAIDAILAICCTIYNRACGDRVPQFSQQQCQHSMTTVMISDRDSKTLYRLYKEAAARSRAGLSEGNGAMSGTQATVYLLC